MNPSSRYVVRGVLAGGALFVGGMTVVAGLAVVVGLIPSVESGNWESAGFLPWIILELLCGLPLAALSGRVALIVGRSIRSPRLLASGVLVLGSLEALALLTSGLAPPDQPAGILVLLSPVLASAAVLAGGRTRVPWSMFSRSTGGVTSGLGFAAPAAVLIAGAAVGIFGFPIVEESGHQRIVALALTLDLVLVAPLLVYALLVRPGRLPLISVVPVAVLGYGVASLSISEDHDAILNVVRWAIIPVEILLLSVVAMRAHRRFVTASGTGDFVRRFREAASDALGNRLAAEIMTTEIAVLYYALQFDSAGSTSDRPSRNRTAPHYHFTMHRSAGYAAVLAGLSMAILVETVAVHMLVRQVSLIAAWILTGLSCYALLWLVGDFRALCSRLTSVEAGSLLFRMGLRWEADIPIARIKSASRVTAAVVSSDQGAFNGVLVGSPNIRIELDGPVTIHGMYGLLKHCRVLHLRIDDPERFIETIGRPTIRP